jgi:hypothetical protein
MLTEAMQSFCLYKIFDVVNREYKIKEIVLENEVFLGPWNFRLSQFSVFWLCDALACR